MKKLKTLLAIDTSCDETAVAITSGSVSLINLVVSQAQLHQPYGGVFPTVAKQAHRDNISAVTKEALSRSGLSWSQIDGLAATVGPGLAPALEVGLNWAQELATKHNKPLLGVNHIEGHLLSVLVSQKSTSQTLGVQIKNLDSQIASTSWPVLGVIVSGKHCEFILVKGIGQYQRLGWTIDDAAGEALDKVGRMLGLGYPAGPVVEKFAQQGDAKRFKFPLPMTTSGDYNLSFSGLKTFARNLIADLETKQTLGKQEICDLAASFQRATFRHLSYKLEKVLLDHPEITQVWLGGGVAANIALRGQIRKSLKSIAQQLGQASDTSDPGFDFKFPYTKKLCGDNAAMIGVAGYLSQERLPVWKEKGQELDRRPRWKIDEN